MTNEAGKVRRWTLENNYSDPLLLSDAVEDASGIWVLHDDYEASERRLVELEGKLESAKAYAQHERSLGNEWAAQRIAELEAQNAELARDAARLEWLVTGTGADMSAVISGSEAHGWGVMDCSNGLTFASRGCKTFRDAIDAAIAKAGETE